MKNIPLNIEIPDMADISETELKILLAVKLYETERLSLGQASDAAGLSKRAFAELLGAYGVSLFSQNADELKRDVEIEFYGKYQQLPENAKSAMHIIIDEMLKTSVNY